MKRDPLKRLLKMQLILCTIYILIVIAGAFLLYLLIPRGVLDAIRATYFSDSPGEF